MIAPNQFEGLTFIATGAVCVVYAKGALQLNPDPERSERLRRKFGPFLLFGGILQILIGLIFLAGLLP
jgi:hypothetical protein